MFLREGYVPSGSLPGLKKLEAIFRHKVFKMLLAKGRITKELIAMLSICFVLFHLFKTRPK